MNIYSIRGAITIEENTRKCIIQNSELLLKTVLEENSIKNDEIINIIFSATKDITKVYPAIATRNLGITDCAIMCTQELYIEESLPMCIRLMLTVNTKKNKADIKHIYLKDAKKLRPDISLKQNPIAIAIDGPAGSGKSTVALKIAKEMNFTYIDTGAMYRAVAYYFLKNNIDYSNKQKISDEIKNINITMMFENGTQQLYLNTENITNLIRTQEISSISSDIAKDKQVREKLVAIQRDFAKGKNVIMDGRDVGTNVLPNAEVKIYLDADVTKRAKRRFDELSEKGENITYDEILKDIKKRDENDKTRDIAPLIKSEDSTYINTTDMSIQDVMEEIIKIIKQNIK